MHIHTPETEVPALIYKDDELIVINKPAGLLAIQDGYDLSLPHLKQILEPQHGPLWIIHRLDKETSGVMVIARNPQAHRILNARFRERQVEKFYHGLVLPKPDSREIEIKLPLQPNADRKHRTRVDRKSGKSAHTICRVLKWFDLGVLMSIQIMTGITHQIRAHLRAHELVLLGDKLYATGLDLPEISTPRMMLHARNLAFDHPFSGERLNFSANYPEDFREAYARVKLSTVQDAMT